MEKSMIRLRMSAKDAHYGGNLVDGAHMVHLFGDVATELLIMHDGDEGLFVAYDNVEFRPGLCRRLYRSGGRNREGGQHLAQDGLRSPQSGRCTPRHLALCGRRTQRARRGLPCQRYVRRKKRTSASLKAANGVFGPFRTRKRPAMRRPQAGAPERENGRCGRKFSANRSEQV